VRFHICHAWTVHQCAAFNEVVDLLAASLRDLGCEVTVAKNKFHANAKNILVGGNMLKASVIPQGIYLIVYQLEQLWVGSTWWNDDIRAILKRADEVWDYDPANIRFLKEHLDIDAKHVIIGYHKSLIRVPRREKDIDVLHYGSMNERRGKIISEIEESGIKVHQAFDVWGPARDELIARAKVVLNLHYYEAAIFEQVRVSYLLNNGVKVVSEDSPFVPYGVATVPTSFALMIDGSTNGAFIDELRFHSKHRCGCDEAEQFMKLPMTKILQGVIEQ
jgi:hypothetical protein